MRKFHCSLPSIAVLFLALGACNNPQSQSQPLPSGSAATGTSNIDFVPVELPATLPGYSDWHFPEDSNRIDTWIKTQDSKAIYQHAWGLWDALTAPSGKTYKGSPLLTFETWHTPEDVQNLLQNKPTRPEERPRHNFQPLHQLEHLPQAAGPQVADVVGFVKWSPSAVAHVKQHRLLYASTLDSMRKTLNGRDAKMIPPFPNTALALKPVFQIMNKIHTTEVAPGVFRLPAWPGSPQVAQPFGNNAWGYFIYIDTNNKASTNNRDITKKQTFVPDAAYGLGDFIWFQADEQMARDMTAAGDTVNAGDYMVLLAMHIATKETRRWTWQTMYWAHNPIRPVPPSSDVVAKERPQKFQTPAAAHYALAVGYSMVQPDQPYTGGSAENATSVYAFNPWLEAGFDKNAMPLPAKVGNTNNIYGVQSNCMSCHAYASYPGLLSPAAGKTNQRLYTADRYVDMQLDPAFTKLRNLQTDFLWSVQGNVIKAK